MTPPADSPRTAAGRALLALPAYFGSYNERNRRAGIRDAILAIEAEASAHADAQASLARLDAIEAEAAAPLRAALLKGIDAHGFIDYPTPRCDCEEWPAKGDPDKYYDDHLATVLAALAQPEREAP